MIIRDKGTVADNATRLPYCWRVNEMSEHLERVRAIASPLDRVLAARALVQVILDARGELAVIQREAILELRNDGWTYQQIANVVGLHRNRIQQIAEGRQR